MKTQRISIYLGQRFDISMHALLQLKKKNYDFFPLNRALSLKQEVGDTQVRLETLVNQVSYLVTKTTEEVRWFIHLIFCPTKPHFQYIAQHQGVVATKQLYLCILCMDCNVALQRIFSPFVTVSLCMVAGLAETFPCQWRILR